MDKTITWIDVETTGLDAHRGYLLEVACLVTDIELNVLDDEGYQSVIFYSDNEVEDKVFPAANPYVREMHAKTGLWERLPHGRLIERVDLELADYIGGYSEPRTSPVAGNSVRLDMNFMDRHLPYTAAHLDYHMIDVSTVAQLSTGWYDIPWIEKHNDHTAMTDIRESIRELKYYREAAFK